MSDFSPQAQAVLDASHFPQRWEHAIAAALRAATDHLKSIDPDDNAYSAGYDTAISDLLAIAYELDGNYPEKPDSSIDSNLKAKLTSCQPVPISFEDGLPGPEDWDSEGCVWLWDNFNRQWDFAYIRTRPRAQFLYCTHWLPYHALPIPNK